MARLARSSVISLSVTFPESSWHEIAELLVVFGKEIHLIFNSSYRLGFDRRQEETRATTMAKHPDLSPAVLCDDVCNLLSTCLGEEDTPERVWQMVMDAIERCNIAV